MNRFDKLQKGQIQKGALYFKVIGGIAEVFSPDLFSAGTDSVPRNAFTRTLVDDGLITAVRFKLQIRCGAIFINTPTEFWAYLA